jgi:hypothetical protein
VAKKCLPVVAKFFRKLVQSPQGRLRAREESRLTRFTRRSAGKTTRWKDDALALRCVSQTDTSEALVCWWQANTGIARPRSIFDNHSVAAASTAAAE